LIGEKLSELNKKNINVEKLKQRNSQKSKILEEKSELFLNNDKN